MNNFIKAGLIVVAAIGAVVAGSVVKDHYFGNDDTTTDTPATDAATDTQAAEVTTAETTGTTETKVDVQATPAE